VETTVGSKGTPCLPCQHPADAGVNFAAQTVGTTWSRQALCRNTPVALQVAEARLVCSSISNPTEIRGGLDNQRSIFGVVQRRSTSLRNHVQRADLWVKGRLVTRLPNFEFVSNFELRISGSATTLRGGGGRVCLPHLATRAAGQCTPVLPLSEIRLRRAGSYPGTGFAQGCRPSFYNPTRHQTLAGTWRHIVPSFVRIGARTTDRVRLFRSAGPHRIRTAQQRDIETLFASKTSRCNILAADGSTSSRLSREEGGD
jgi:hypothetical protein